MQIVDNSTFKNYETTCDWPKECSVQGGSKGVVASKKHGSYETAYFEVFTNKMFIRGEGKTMSEAEEQAFYKYHSYISCSEHKYERVKGYKNGMGRCVKCGFMTIVFEDEHECIVCNKHENFTRILSKYRKNENSCICEECSKKKENFYLMSGMTIRDLVNQHNGFKLFSPVVDEKTIKSLKFMPSTIEKFYSILENDSNPFILEYAKRIIQEEDEDDIRFRFSNEKASSYEELYTKFYRMFIKPFEDGKKPTRIADL